MKKIKERLGRLTRLEVVLLIVNAILTGEKIKLSELITEVLK